MYLEIEYFIINLSGMVGGKVGHFLGLIKITHSSFPTKINKNIWHPF